MAGSLPCWSELAWLSQGVPGIVVALALVTLTLGFAEPLYQTSTLLVLAYAILFLPLALVSVRAALLQAQARHAEAGRTLGLGPIATALRITLPLGRSRAWAPRPRWYSFRF